MVRRPLRDGAHLGALASVPVAAGAEDHDDTSLSEVSGRLQRGIERVGSVGVVDDDGEVLAGAHRLEPAWHLCGLRQTGGDACGAHPQSHRDLGRDDCVAPVEGSGQGQRHCLTAPAEGVRMVVCRE